MDIKWTNLGYNSVDLKPKEAEVPGWIENPL
jgi:hypothetical protein